MKKILLILSFLLIGIVLSADENRLLVRDHDLKAVISFDREKYRIGEETVMNVEILNLENEAVNFYTSPYKLNNIRINLLDLQKGETLEEKYSRLVEISRMKEEKPELFRTEQKRLYPDEVLKFRIDLQEYFEFAEPGRYKVRVEFDPFPGMPEEHRVIISNPVYLRLEKSPARKEVDDLIHELSKIEEAKSYTPDGTVRFMLDAYGRKDWANYFLYQDLSTLILQYAPFRQRFLTASESLRAGITAEFKNWFMNQKNRDLENYTVLEFSQSNEENRASVRCRVKYKKPAEFNTFYYLYWLRREGVKWIVYDVEVISYSKEK